MRLVVLGANGQIGRELTRSLTPLGDVVALDRAGCDLARLDMIPGVVHNTRPDVLVNAAGYTAVDKAETDEALATLVNGTAPGVIAHEARKVGALLVHYSTDYVFDGAKPGPYVEDDPVVPLGVYGASKEAGEAAIRTRYARHVILRTAWVFGVHGNNFVKTMLRLGAERPTLGIVADQRGCPTEAADIARVIARIAATLLGPDKAAGRFGTFHYVGEPATTWHGFAEAIFRRVAARGRTVPILNAIATADYPTSARRPANSVLATDKLARAYGIAPCDWQVALDRVIAGLLDAPQPAATAGSGR